MWKTNKYSLLLCSISFQKSKSPSQNWSHKNVFRRTNFFWGKAIENYIRKTFPNILRTSKQSETIYTSRNFTSSQRNCYYFRFYYIVRPSSTFFSKLRSRMLFIKCCPDMSLAWGQPKCLLKVRALFYFYLFYIGIAARRYFKHFLHSRKKWRCFFSSQKSSTVIYFLWLVNLTAARLAFRVYLIEHMTYVETNRLVFCFGSSDLKKLQVA